MRILHIDTGRQFHGGQRQVLLLMNTLRAAGIECCLLALPQGELWRQAQLSGFAPAPSSLFSTWQRSLAFDLIHAHDAHAHTLAALAARLPFVVSRRVAFPVVRSFASRWKYLRPARFLAVSQFVAKQLQSAGVPPQKIDIVYDAIEASVPSADWSPQGPVVALASIDPKKGRDLVEAASKIARVPIVFSTDLSKDLLHASLFLYISRSEGFGSAALLAMSMGIPVIGSRIGGLTESFEDGISGIAVDNDPAAIAQATLRVLHETEIAPSLIKNARIRVGNHFTTEHLLSGTLASYRRALGL